MKKYFSPSYYQRYSPHYLPNLKLALPVVFSQAGQMIVAIADTLMVGQIGATELAAVSFANSVFIIGFVLSIGLAVAVTPLVGKAYGASEPEKCSFWLKQGLVSNIVFAFLLMGIMFLSSRFLPFMGQEEKVIKLAVPYFLILVSSILPFSVFMVFKQFGEGISSTRLAMVVTLIANIVNIVLNYLLIFGKLGFPQMGVNGAGWATLISRVFMAITFVLVFYNLKFFKEYKIAFKKVTLSTKELITTMKLGFPIGGQMVIEVFAFSMGAIMMGWMGEKPMAAHQIVISLASLTYMMALGLSSAATIKVSNYFGANDNKSLKYSAYAVIHKVILFMICNGIMFVSLRKILPDLFINDTEVISIAASLMIIAGVFQVFDGMQAVWLGILRGIQDVKIPSLIAFITWIVLALPVSYLCAFVFNMGPIGIWIGYLLGLFIASMLLMFRFKRILRLKFVHH